MKMLVCITLALAAWPTLAQDANSSKSPNSPKATEPKVQRIVVQDDQVRIEEERVRGVTRKVTVKPKDAAAYEIIPSNAARDPSQAHRGSEGATGKRVWNVLNF